MEPIEIILVGVGVLIVIFALSWFKKGFEFTVGGNPYILSGLMRKRKVIILHEEHPDKIKTITEGVFGEQGLYLTKEKKLLKNILFEKDIYILIELPDGSYVPTTFVIFRKDDVKKNQKAGFLVEEFHKYNRLLNYSIEKIDLFFKEKKLTIFDSFIEQVKRNAGLIALIGSILLLTIGTTMINVAQASKLVEPHTELLSSLSTCQETLQSCVQICQQTKTNITYQPQYNPFQEVIK